MQKVDEFIAMAKPLIDDDTIEEVVRVLKSGWIATGPVTREFEKKLSEYFGGRTVMCFSSATAGLHAALMAVGVGSGDEVITTPMTFAATANVIAMLGARPVFVDIDPGTINIDPSKVEVACTSKTKAIMPVHYAGLPVDMDPIFDIAARRNLRVIEDAAHATGSCYKNQKIGSFGDIQVFSFHPIKNMTSAEGGCVVLDSGAKNEQKILELQRFHGIDRSIWDRFSAKSSGFYDVVCPGFKSNMSDLQSAIGVHQLDAVDAMNERRRKLADRYRLAFADMFDHVHMQSVPDYSFVHSGHLFPLCVLDWTQRETFMEFMKNSSIGVTPYYAPVHLFTYYRRTFGYTEGDFPHAEYVGKRIVSIPLHTSLTEDAQDYVIETVRRFFYGNKNG